MKTIKQRGKILYTSKSWNVYKMYILIFLKKLLSNLINVQCSKPNKNFTPFVPTVLKDICLSFLDLEYLNLLQAQWPLKPLISGFHSVKQMRVLHAILTVTAILFLQHSSCLFRYLSDSPWQYTNSPQVSK